MEYEVVFPGEGLVRKAGRGIYSDYEQLRDIILDINEKNVPFLNCLGLDTEPEKILQLCGMHGLALQGVFVDYVVKRKAKLFQEGKISVSAIIHPSGRLGFDEYPGGVDRKSKKLNYIDIPPYTDDASWSEGIIRQKILDGARREYIGVDLKESVPRFLMRKKYGRWLIVRFKEILKDVEERTRMFWQATSTENLRRAELFLEAITYSQEEEGLVIDGRKFLAKYLELSEGRLSVIHQRHQEAASALNEFFGGNVTEQKLNKFFVIEDGIVKTNPKSINNSGYLELL